MASAIFVFCLIQLAVAICLFLYFFVWLKRRHKQTLFKPLTNLKEADPRIDGRRRVGPVCFITGMARAVCACAECQRPREG